MSSVPHILFIFLDGVGLGADIPEHNPFARLSLPAFERLGGGRWLNPLPERLQPHHCVRAIDATLGLEGLPQSGTGQATLFTGINCAMLAGRHYGPFPHSKTKPVLASDNVFHKVKALGLPAAFANAYPDRFFEMVQLRNRWTVTTLCCRAAGVPLRRFSDLEVGNAVAADLTGRGWRRIGYTFPPIPEAEAGRRLAALSEAHAFTLYEYYLTDKAGHSQSMAQATLVLQPLDRLFAGLLPRLDPDRHLLLLTSDHGNLEDLSTRSHTRNPVPFIAHGFGAEGFAGVQSLADVTPALIQVLEVGNRPTGRSTTTAG